MSFYIAIPSVGDTDSGRFKRLAPPTWDIKNKIIQIRPDGLAEVIDADRCAYDGLVIVGRAFLRENSAAATKLMLSNAKVKESIDGIFLHPGVTNDPGMKEVKDAIERLPKPLGNVDGNGLLERTVAFTHSGFKKYQVPCLRAVWEWLTGPRSVENEEKRIPNFDLQSLKGDFDRLRRLTGRDLLVELFILSQGCVDQQVDCKAQEGFVSLLKKDLGPDGKASWLQKDGRFQKTVEAILQARGNAPADCPELSLFTEALRSALEAEQG